MEPISSNGDCVIQVVYALDLAEGVKGMYESMIATEDADAARRLGLVLASYQGRLNDVSARIQAYVHRFDKLSAPQ